MSLVFVSHSKYDVEIVSFFSDAITQARGLQGKLMEFENLKGLYAGVEISDIIRRSSTGCLIVLLGRNIESPPRSPVHTRNWVNFEVGVAAGFGKPVWVFEEYGADIHFPIPYVTDYCRYHLDDEAYSQYIGQILLYKLAGGKSRRPTYCSYCHARFYYWNDDTVMTCPVCRHSPYRKRNRINLRLSNVV